MRRLSLVLLLLLAAPVSAQDFKLPPGYSISEYAGDALASDIHALTIDPRGRVVVSGKNYIRVLIDDPKTGKAAKAVDFSTEPKSGAQGLLWEGKTLLFVGDDGLRKLVDDNGDDKADGPSTAIRPLRTGIDHGAHALRRGPDGWLYLLAGDQAGIADTFAELPTSPVGNPIGGCVVRFHPVSGKSEIVAHGFRNPYDFDFDARGRLFTFDSDNERCIGMPWYEHTRLYHVAEGAYHGWLGPQFSPRLWRIPPYAPDTAAPLATFGRGSPTFVLAASTSPQATTLLLGDWTFGKIHRSVVPATSLGGVEEASVFLDSAPGVGFAPTAAAMHPKTGDIFIATGGRGTRGAVYRLRGFAPPQKFPGRVPLATEPVQDANKEIARAAVDADPLVRLRALERIARRRPDDAPPLLDPVVRDALAANWESGDRALAFAAARAASVNPKVAFKRDASLAGRRTDLVARILAGDAFDPALALPLIESDDDQRIVDGLCLLQRRLELPAEPGSAWEAYAGTVSPEARKAIAPAVVRLIERLKPDSTPLHREAIRTFALVGADVSAAPLVAWLRTPLPPTERFHLLAALAHCGPKLGTGETAATAQALLDLDAAYAKAGVPREANWPTRFGEMTAMLFARDPSLADAVLAHPSFGMPEHAAVALAKGFPRAKAANVFLKKLRADPKYPLDARTLALLGEIDDDDDIAALVRPHWGSAGVDEAILPLLARKPLVDDRRKFVAGLRSLQPKTVQTCIRGLRELNAPADDDEIVALVTAWDQAGDKQPVLVASIVERLQVAAKTKLDANRAAWRNSLEIQRPEVAKRLALVDGVDRLKWQKRLDAVDWSKGDAKRGRAVFIKTNCAACHSSTQTIGPDLVGVAGRFNRDDLFTAILQPNKDVPDRYRLTQVETREGKVHLGILVYNAFDGLMLRTGVAETVRVPGPSIESRAVVARSLMPAGLLDAATDADLADLYAYLLSLAKP